MIGLILKKTLAGNNPRGEGCFYDALNDQQKQNIKTTCLGQLIDQNTNIKKSAGGIVALIYQLDYKNGGWFDLLTNLSKNT